MSPVPINSRHKKKLMKVREGESDDMPPGNSKKKDTESNILKKKRSAKTVNFLIKQASQAFQSDDSKNGPIILGSSVEEDASNLLNKSGLHIPKKPISHDYIMDHTSDIHNYGQTETSSVINDNKPPHQRYHVEEDYLQALNRDVEWAGEVASATARLNSSAPEKTIGHLKEHPIEKWPPLKTLFYSKVWNLADPDTGTSYLMNSILEAFQCDLADIVDNLGVAEEAANNILQTNTRHIEGFSNKTASASKHEEDDVNMSVSIMQSGQTEKKIVKTLPEKQTNKILCNTNAPPPFLRPLNGILKTLQESEQTNFLLDRCLNIYDSTQNFESVLEDNIQTVEQLGVQNDNTQGDSKCSESSDDWEKARHHALWKCRTAAPSVSLPSASFLETSLGLKGKCGGDYAQIFESLQHFNIVTPQTWIPQTRFCRNFLRHFARCNSHLVSSYTNSYVYPFQWLIKDTPELILSQHASLDDQKCIISLDASPNFIVKTVEPNKRFYMGHALSIWGLPSNSLYLRACMTTEFMFMLKRMTKPFRPLHVVRNYPSLKQRPNHIAVKINRTECNNSQAASGSSSLNVTHQEAINTALALQTDGGHHLGLGTPQRLSGLSNIGSGIGQRTTEKDSSESEGERKERQFLHRSGSNLDQHLTSTHQFYTQGYAHDHDVVHIGRFGKLRSAWCKPRRKRLGLEAVYATQGKLAPAIPAEYSSSEESAMGLVVDQKQYRIKARSSKGLLKSQKAKAHQQSQQQLEEITDTSEPNRVMQFMIANGLGPLDPVSVLPLRPREWPKSPLDSYEYKKKQKKENTEIYDSKKKNQHPLALDSLLNNISTMGSQEDCFHDLSQKKRRIRGFEPRFDRDPKSKLPIGFAGLGIDLNGSEYQFVGLDNCELGRRMGNNKMFQDNLGCYSDFLKGSRDYYAVIDEETNTTAIIPGSVVSLFWTKTAKQNYEDLHWYAFWRYWATGKYRRRFIDKALRYKSMKQFGWYLWQSQIDKLPQIQERISEMSAYRKAKYARPRIHSYLARRQLDKLACLNFANLNRHEEEIEDIQPLLLSDHDVESPELIDLLVDTKNTNEDNQKSNESPLITDNECMLPSALPIITAKDDLSKIDLSKEAEKSRQECESAFNHYRYSTFFLRRHAKIPAWALGWNHVRTRSRRTTAERYGALLSQYYQQQLPEFIKRYQEARLVMAEKHQAENEYAAVHKRTEQKKSTVGGDLPTLDEQQPLKTNNKDRLSAQEEKIQYMRACLPTFNLKANEPKAIYDADNVLPPHLVEEVFPRPMDEILVHGLTSDAHDETTNLFIQSLTHTVKRLIDIVRQKESLNKDSHELQFKASQLKILNWLIKLYPFHRKNFRSIGSFNQTIKRHIEGESMTHSVIPSATLQWLRDHFFDKDESSEVYMRQEGEIRLMTTILWLCVYLQGDWHFDFQPLLVSDWHNLYTEKFQKWAKLMGLRRQMLRKNEHGDNASISVNKQNWKLEAPLTVSDNLHRGKGGIGAVESTFGKSSAAIFFKDEGKRSRRFKKIH